jgi:hypothetical protein
MLYKGAAPYSYYFLGQKLKNVKAKKCKQKIEILSNMHVFELLLNVLHFVFTTGQLKLHMIQIETANPVSV